LRWLWSVLRFSSLAEAAKALFAVPKKAIEEKKAEFVVNGASGNLPPGALKNVGRCAILLVTLPLASCGLAGSRMPTGPTYLTAVTQERKDCDAGNKTARTDYQARVAHCHDVQNRESTGAENAPLMNTDPYACVGIDL
jgi:hypothetical protein